MSTSIEPGPSIARSRRPVSMLASAAADPEPTEWALVGGTATPLNAAAHQEAARWNTWAAAVNRRTTAAAASLV